MKQQIRLSVFETNSSSMHSITITDKSIYDDWNKNKVLYCSEDEKFLNTDEAVKENLKRLFDNSDLEEKYSKKELKELVNKYKKTKSIEETFIDISDDIEYYYLYLTNEEWYEKIASCYETYSKEYKTKNGDKVVAFGYYGQD